MDCIFCSIIKGEIPCQKVYENDRCYAFRDINPQAPVHVIIVPKVHIQSVQHINAENSVYVSAIFEAIPVIAEQLGLGSGYRVISNCGEDGGQTVPHLHFHLLGGAKLGEKIL